MANWLESDAGKRYGLNETEMAFAAGNLLTAGGDVSTTAVGELARSANDVTDRFPLLLETPQLPDVTFRIFILTMLHHPEIAARARAEIDRVVGRDRLPSFEDKEDLPLTRAIILETQRWRPLSPIGICHVATEVRPWGCDDADVKEPSR